MTNCSSYGCQPIQNILNWCQGTDSLLVHVYKLSVKRRRGRRRNMNTKGDCHYGTEKSFYYMFPNCDYCYNLKCGTYNRLKKNNWFQMFYFFLSIHST